MSENKIFEQVATPHPKMSAFDLSHDRKFSTDMGILTPILCEEANPGDVMSINSECMVRLAPMIAPMMHQVDVYVHHFFVPNRIIWDQWEEFITGGEQGDTTVNTVPALALGTYDALAHGSLADFLGCPTLPDGSADPTTPVNVSQLPFRAYQQIYNDYYRDENLEEETDITDNSVQTTLRRRAWQKDYFTSALPFPQKGPDVVLSNNVNYKTVSEIITSSTSQPVAAGNNLNINPNTAGQLNVSDTNAIPPAQISNVRVENIDSITAGTIEELRRAARLQEYYEILARGGSRYKEFLKSFFDENLPDGRLQRAEYYGGGKQPVIISEVLNTTGITGSNPNPSENGAVQGAMSGHGIAVGGKNQGSYKAQEYGWFISIMSVMPKPAYQQGLPRKMNRGIGTQGGIGDGGRYDFVNPKFFNIGEQEVLNKELYYDFTVPSGSAPNNDVFGYQMRYAEYRYIPCTVHGDFKENLDEWHLGRIFTDTPPLNKNFITMNKEDTYRVFAAGGTDNTLWCQIYNSVKMRRKMPYFPVPTL